MDMKHVADRARQIIAGAEASPGEALQLVQHLHAARQFGLARRMLERLDREPGFRQDIQARPELELELAQKLSLSTYKDPDLQIDLKHRRALAILQEADPLDRSVNQETLGQAGAIYRRLWEYSGREAELETSLAFYRRGYEQGVRGDFGYTAINAAFALDLLADLGTPDGQPAGAIRRSCEERRAQARKIRSDVIDACVPLADANPEIKGHWWFLVTIGEAYFGVRDYASAQTWLETAAALRDVPDWQFESAARQLAALLRMQQREERLTGKAVDGAGEQVLGRFLGGAKPALDSVVRGKVGLALSGGGFRASLFHIGVLARLAELDLLRTIEYISCVSGGSIIGAHYYLELRRLLRDKADQEITRQDYIEIVARVCDDFLAGVQRNIRTRIAAEWSTNLKLMLSANYSRTQRAGELYEREIYARVQDGENGERWLNELRIQPKGERPDFRPKDHNWRRAAKVPILVLNATSLNTGHNWQFTCSWMGEPPAGIESEVDANYRLRRMYYEQAPNPHKRVRLGHAVAASACVPGLFEPLTLANLYERESSESSRVRPVVRLVDGGVHDNQGVAALLEQGCSVLLVSDASGQMSDQDEPSAGLLGVPLRANSILQARVRVSQYEDLESRRRAGTLKGLMFVHLKKDLETRPVDWIETQDPADEVPNRPMTKYGVQKSVQRRLAAIRTDLDSFSDAEAYALMTSAYLMTDNALRAPILGFPAPSAAEHPWKFLQVKQAMQAPGSDTWLHRQLKVADKLAFKVWYVARRLQIAAGVAAVGLLSFGAFQVYTHWNQIRASLGKSIFVLTVSDVAIGVGLAALSLLGLGAVARLLNYRKTLQQMFIGFGMATIGFLFARLHLHVFDRMFLWQGRIPRSLPKQRSADRMPARESTA